MHLSCNPSWSMPQRSIRQILGVSMGPLSYCPCVTSFPAPTPTPSLWKHAALILDKSSVLSFQTLEKPSIYMSKKFPEVDNHICSELVSSGKGEGSSQASCLFWLSKDFSLFASSALNKISQIQLLLFSCLWALKLQVRICKEFT